jgi:hypothetical protein
LAAWVLALLLSACGGGTGFTRAQGEDSGAAGSSPAGGTTSGGSAGDATNSGGSAGSEAGGDGGTTSAGSGGSETGGDSGSTSGGSGGFETGGDGGSTSGGSGGSATGGSTGSGGSPTGGVGPVEKGTCVANAGVTSEPVDAETKGVIRGDNGVFTDECDADGNLVEYVCETEMVCDEPPNPACESFTTGQVIAQNLDCVGTCVDGSCAARCPDFGDQVTYLTLGEADGAATFRNETDGRNYSCDLIFEGGSDCRSESRIGSSHTIQSLGLRGGPCTGLDFGNIGLEGCSYRCDILP